MNDTLKLVGAIFASILAIVFSVLGFVSVVAGIILLPSFVGWLLWNQCLAELVHGPHLRLWQVFAVLWVLGLIGRLFKRS